MERQLVSFIQQHMLDEKCLFVGAHHEGRALLARLALGGQHWINLSPLTVTDYIGRMLSEDWAFEGWETADATMVFLLVAELSANIPEAQAYFGRVGESPGVLRSIYAALSTLRRHGVAAESMDETDFIDPSKGKALIALLFAYEEALKKRRWLDEAEILRQGTRRLKDGIPECPWFLIPWGVWLRSEGLERAFFEVLPVEKTLILGNNGGTGLDIPSRRMQHVYADQDSLAVDGFAAAGVTAEVREIFRRIVDEGHALESVSIITPSHGHYEQALKDTATRLGIPLTSGRGWPIMETRPGQAVYAYLQWIRRDYPVCDLSAAWVSGSLLPPIRRDGTSLSYTSAARLLRSSGIGWGRERYMPMLAALVQLAEASGLSTEELEGENGKERYERWQALKDWISRLLEITPTPDADGCLGFVELCQAVERVAREFSTVITKDDAAARTAIAELMRRAVQWGTGRLTPHDAVDRLMALIQEIRWGASGPRPGAVHLSSWSSSWTVGRPRLFMIGLDEANAALRPSPDPLLLDEERIHWNPSLPTGMDRIAPQQAAIAWSFQHLTGHMTLSYSAISPENDRESSPSPLLLSIYRWVAGDCHKGYRDLLNFLGTPIGQIPSDGKVGLFVEEAWMRRLAMEPHWGVAMSAVLESYPHLARGRSMMEARNSDIFTVYDGRIDADPERLDPCCQRSMIISASRLEMLGRCPLGYFFRYVLGVRPPREPIRDPSIWLDALERGDVLHDIYHNFYQRLGRRVNGSSDEEQILWQIYEDVLLAKRQVLPPPSEAVFERERIGITTAAMAFLALERQDMSAATPRWFEVPFGFGPESVEEGQLGSEDPVLIRLTDGRSFHFAGRIDRIDESHDHEYHVWDYKTGRPYSDHGVVRRGRRLQHALYAMAAEILLQQEVDPLARVTRSGYRFSTVQGEGQPVWLAEGDARSLADKALCALLTMVNTGVFPAAEDGDGCRSCDYQSVCTDEPSKAIRRKMEANDPWLAPLMEVKEIE